VKEKKALRSGGCFCLSVCGCFCFAFLYVCVSGRAGATASVNCSVCQAGTYGTGSGEGLQMKFVLLGPARHPCSALGLVH
jgi:hypothetical protein